MKIKEIVTLLQNKYSNHKFIKEIENIILRDFTPELRDFVSRNTKYNLEGEKYFGIMEPKKYLSKTKIPQYILEKFMNKAQYHKTYVMYVNRQLKMDSEIISKINTEIVYITLDSIFLVILIFFCSFCYISNY